MSVLLLPKSHIDVGVTCIAHAIVIYCYYHTLFLLLTTSVQLKISTAQYFTCSSL